MNTLRNQFHKALLFSFVFFTMIFFFSFRVSAEDVEWLEVSRTNNELLSIKPNSLKYNKKGFLSVIARHSEIDQNNQSIINDDAFLMAIDCKNRLYSKYPANTDFMQEKDWENPINNKLIKKTIINSCSY